TTNLTVSSIETLISRIVNLADKDRLSSYYPNYKNRIMLDSIVQNLQDELIKNYSITSALLPALDMLIGKDTIPVMTIHKSKGL
ncbi:hypothetical protein ABTD21_19935, partial [Acinetobacter baumannii]